MLLGFGPLWGGGWGVDEKENKAKLSPVLLGLGLSLSILEFSTKGGGSARPDFPLRKKAKKKPMGLKHWIMPKDHFKTLIFFLQFLSGGPFSAWIGSWSEAEHHFM